MISEAEQRMALNKEYVLGGDERELFQRHFINYLDDSFDRYSCRVTYERDHNGEVLIVVGATVYVDREWYVADIFIDNYLLKYAASPGITFVNHLSQLIEKLNRAIRNKDHT